MHTHTHTQWYACTHKHTYVHTQTCTHTHICWAMEAHRAILATPIYKTKLEKHINTFKSRQLGHVLLTIKAMERDETW